MTKLGPAGVDRYFLPTIEYVAGSFHALAPQPPPLTKPVHMQSPMPAAFTSTVFSTSFVKPAGSETTTMPFTVYGYPSQEDYSSEPENGESGRLSQMIDWWSHSLHTAAEATLMQLRRLLDNFTYQVVLFTAIFITYRLLENRNEENTQTTTAIHHQQILGIQEELTAKDLEIASLKEQLKNLVLRQNDLLEEARKDVEARNLAEEHVKKRITELSSELKDKDNALAGRDKKVAAATKRAETAENSNTMLEKKAKTSRSDFDSHSQKKENEIEKLKRACQEAAKEDETARRELKEAKAQASKDRKNVTELEKQVTESKKKAAELEVQIKEKEATLVQKDKALKERTDAKTSYAKSIHELRASLLKANNLRQIAEEKASNQEALAAKTVDQCKAAEATASEQRKFAAEAWQQTKAAEAKAAEQEALATEARQTPKGEGVSTLLEQNDLPAAASGDKESPKTESQDAMGEDEHAVGQAPLATPSDADKLPSTRTRVRCNRRRDGTIRTAKHPLSTPPKQPGLREQRPPIDEQKALDGQQTSTLEKRQEEVGSANPKRVRRVCPYFPLGTCKFGDRCFDAHVVPSSS